MENILEIKGVYNKDCKIFTTDIEESALSLVYSILNTKEYADVPIRIMPDVHTGVGIVIGFSAPITHALNPSFVGVDIGCTITTYITNIPINKDDFPIIEHRIKKEIPMGMEINKTRQFEMKTFYKFMKSEFNKAQRSWPDMINDFDISEDGMQDFVDKFHMDYGKFCKSIGSVGGGNHFIEVGEYNGCYAFTVHCGSRNLGQRVCKYWENIASSAQVDNKIFKEKLQQLKNTVEDKTKLPKLIEELKEDLKSKMTSNGYLVGENLKGYLTDMVIAQAYAKFNHQIIGEKITSIFKKIYPKLKIIEVIQSIHNYVDMEDHIIRKGAIRAYEGEKMVVPFNMRDGLAICVGKSNPDWNYSCSHGAGRKLSRGKAKSQISLDDFKKSMEGIYSTTISYNTLDESPMAYKDANTILDLIQDTCEVLYVVKPLINIKSDESIASWLDPNNA